MSEHELWNELGNLYFMSGAYNQAVYAYNRSIQIDGNFGRPYSNLALTYVQQGKYQEAIELYRSSIELLADNKEKAISWSRLGNVYRHLKDYKKAVIAYQEADELDPQSTADDKVQNITDEPEVSRQEMPQSGADSSSQPNIDIGSPEIATVDINLDAEQPAITEPILTVGDANELTSSHMDSYEESPSASEDISVISLPLEASKEPSELIVFQESPPSSPIPVEISFPSVGEYWPKTSPQPETDSLDDSTASWALADMTRYEQDFSDSPDSGSLTIWGEPDSSEDDDWDLYPAIEPDSDVYSPDPDGDELEKWLPFPEDEPHNELEALELFKELKNEMVEPDVKHSLAERVTESSDYLESSTVSTLQASTEFIDQNLATLAEQIPVEFPKQEAEVIPLALPATSSGRSQSKFNRIELEVEERSSVDIPSHIMNDFIMIESLEEQANEPQTVQIETVEVTPDPLARDPQEMADIEAGIAKFKRAVQVNPHNAYAWDALGTLYKSAGNYEEAILAYQQATSINPPKALYFHNLGLVYACEARDEDAISAFEKVIEIDPEYSLAHATLGGYYRKKGMEELAKQHIGKAMKNIFDSENEYNRACLEAICGNTDHAIELLGIALKNKQTYVDWILRDPDLDFIRQDPRFKQLVSDYTR